MKIRIKEKMIKRSLGLLLCIVVFLLSIIIGVVVYQKKDSEITVQQMESTKEVKTKEMMEELMLISQSLDKMDGSVENNLDALGKITGYGTEMTEQVNILDNTLSHMESQIQNCLTKYENSNQEIAADLTNMVENIVSIREHVVTVGETVTDLLIAIQSDDAKGQKDIEGKLEKLQESIEENKRKMMESYKNLETMLNTMQEYSDADHKETIELLAETKEYMDSVLLEEINNLSLLICDENKKLQIQIEKTTGRLEENMESLHLQIGNVKDEISSLLRIMEENNTERQEEVRTSFAEIQLTLTKINEGFVQSQEEIKLLIRDIEQAEAENHMELLSVLGNMENGMEESGSKNLSQILTSIGDMEQNYNNSVQSLQNEISQKFENMGSVVTTQIGSLNETVNSQNQTLTTTVNAGNNNLQQYLKNAFDTVNQKMESVFQYVSDGKKILASALLTKGVSCKEDATFKKIGQAILSIPQKIVIGVEQIPGEVTYDYHYHINTGGENPHTDKQEQHGGCYTAPIYHVHAGDYKNGGGCYNIPNIHDHADNCYTTTRFERKITAHWFTGQGTGHQCCDNAHGQNYAKFRYTDNTYRDGELISSVDGEGDLGYCCALCIEQQAAKKGHDSTTKNIICGYSEGLNGYDLGCGNTTQSVVAYSPGCGFSDGQITGAHILYDENSFRMEMKEQHVMEQEAVAENPEEQNETAVDMESTEEIEAKTIETENMEIETIETGTIETENMETETIETETIETETIETEILDTQTIETEILDTETESYPEQDISVSADTIANAVEQTDAAGTGKEE